jgi:hypothetical protein
MQPSMSLDGPGLTDGQEHILSALIIVNKRLNVKWLFFAQKSPPPTLSVAIANAASFVMLWLDTTFCAKPLPSP